MISKQIGDHIVIPGLASAHSHAFQRAMRGHCQRKQSELGSFWSWRGRMYEIAGKLSPESMYKIARFAYAELAMSGVCAVGEFHYVHHQSGGQAYDNRTELSDAMIAAAQDVGIRITLLRVIYERAGFDKALEPGQERFCDSSIDDSLSDIDDLRSRYLNTEGVEIGLAIHSIRAVTRESIAEVSQYAKRHALPLHMHLCEQRRELEECTAEYGSSPVAVMHQDGILDKNFIAVHATHLAPEEIIMLSESGAGVCVCRTTERDLGDGHCEADKLFSAGIPLCTGVDSYASSDPFEEARAIELDQRSHREARTVVGDPSSLLSAASENGYAAIGMQGQSCEDQVMLRGHDPSLVGFEQDSLDDTVVFATSPRAVDQVSVAGQRIVEGGVHRDYSRIREEFETTLHAMR